MGHRMCNWRLEPGLIAILTIPATILMVVSMSTKSWVIGHLQMNKQIVARISPWYLCVNQCLTSEDNKTCREDQVTRFKGMYCFWMRDWSTYGFGRCDPVTASLLLLVYSKKENWWLLSRQALLGWYPEHILEQAYTLPTDWPIQFGMSTIGYCFT